MDVYIFRKSGKNFTKELGNLWAKKTGGKKFIRKFKGGGYASSIPKSGDYYTPSAPETPLPPYAGSKQLKSGVGYGSVDTLPSVSAPTGPSTKTVTYYRFE